MKPFAVICDLDGTLCDVEHRRHLVEGKEKKWDEFGAACLYDKPVLWCQMILRGLVSQKVRVVLVSGRMEKHRPHTESWLKEHMNWLPVIDYKLFMRPNEDYTPDNDLKLSILQTAILPMYEVLCSIDDRKKVVTMWRANKIPTLHCAEGDF
jgi:hypothetical protein